MQGERAPGEICSGNRRLPRCLPGTGTGTGTAGPVVHKGGGGGRNAGSPVTRGWGGCWRGGDTHTRLVGRRARKSLNLKNTIPKKDF